MKKSFSGDRSPHPRGSGRVARVGTRRDPASPGVAMRPSRHSQWSFRVRSKGSVDEDVSVQRLRTTLTNSLVNMGLLSAFMCALANGIYANPPGDPM